LETVIIVILVGVFLIGLKIWVFSSEEEKCFRRIWSMTKSGIYQEKEATYQRLFRKYDIVFSNKVSDDKLSLLIRDAHVFDMTKNKRPLGVYVGPIVEREVRAQMTKHGKQEQYEKLSAE